MSHFNAGDFLTPRENISPLDFKAGIDEALGAARAHTVHQFERTRPENERLGFVGAVGIFVDEADGQAVALQF